MESFINDESEPSWSDDESDGDSDYETDNESTMSLAVRLMMNNLLKVKTVFS